MTVEKAISIGFLVGLAILLTSCDWRDQANLEVLRPPRSDRPEMLQVVSIEGAGWPSVVLSVPIDDKAKQLGSKVFVMGEARIFQSPRENTPEYYRVGQGAALWVTPTKNKEWLKVQMSRGRSGYVRASQVSPLIELA